MGVKPTVELDKYLKTHGAGSQCNFGKVVQSLNYNENKPLKKDLKNYGYSDINVNPHTLKFPRYPKAPKDLP